MDENIDEFNIANNIDKASNSFTLNSIEEIPSSKVINSVECHWMLGQLAWARIGNYPFWPCMVTDDPTSRIYYKFKGTTRSIIMIHVHYFGDKGRHSWVSANCMLQFTCLADFLKLAESLTAETKKKNAKYAAAFVVKLGIKKKWQNAVQEAVEAQSITTEKRIAIFATKVKIPKCRDAKSFTVDEKNQNQRKRSRLNSETEQNGLDIKRAKQNNVHDTKKPEVSMLHKSELSKKNLQITHEKIDSKLISDSSPSFLSHKSSFKSAKIYKNEVDEKSTFKLYYEGNKNLLENEYPSMSKDDIKKYLQKTYNNMNMNTKKNWIAHDMGHMHLKESSPDEDEISMKIDTTVKKKTVKEN